MLKSVNSVQFHAEALKSKFHAKFRECGILDALFITSFTWDELLKMVKSKFWLKSVIRAMWLAEKLTKVKT